MAGRGGAWSTAAMESTHMCGDDLGGAGGAAARPARIPGAAAQVHLAGSRRLLGFEFLAVDGVARVAFREKVGENGGQHRDEGGKACARARRRQAPRMFEQPHSWPLLHRQQCQMGEGTSTPPAPSLATRHANRGQGGCPPPLSSAYGPRAFAHLCNAPDADTCDTSGGQSAHQKHI